jgi:hypothetical protein
MPNPLFQVDRRPCVHIADPITFSGVDERWGGPVNYGAQTINLATGARLPGIGTYELIGVQRTIATMQYHYERGIRRFMINSPQGTVAVTAEGFPAYGGIWSCMQQRTITNWDGSETFVNPNMACWPGRTVPPTLEESATASFISFGRTNEWFEHLRVWLLSGASLGYNVGMDGTTPMTDKRGDVEIYIYTGFGIPFKTGAVDFNANYVKVLGNAENKIWMNNPNGFQMPDPDNKSDHANYLTSEWNKWFNIGVSGVGGDVGVYAANYRHGDWVYQLISDGTNIDTITPTTYDVPLTNMRRWFENHYFSLPIGTGVGTAERFNTVNKFKYFIEGFPWDVNAAKITNRSSSFLFPEAGTDEAYGFLDSWGAPKLVGTSRYSNSWMHYTPYIQLLDGLTTFKNGAYQFPTNQFNGSDPNNKWRFDPTTTEIHILVTDPARPFTSSSDPELTALSNTINSPATQAKVEQCVDFWLDFMDRGYVYMFFVSPDGYVFNRTVHKRIMEELGHWPSGQVI